MTDEELHWIEVSRLRAGMVVQLDIGWQHHPFPFNRFMLRGEEQIAAIRALGLTQVRYLPQRSQAGPLPREDDSGSALMLDGVAAAGPAEQGVVQDWRQQLADQQLRLADCEAQFRHVSRCYKQTLQHLRVDPDNARRQAQLAVARMVEVVDIDHEVTIRLLSERVDDEGAAHPVNVAVLSLLLGRACGLDAPQLRELGMAALLHDIGKLDLPGFLRFGGQRLSDEDRRTLEQHVPFGVETAKRIGLSQEAQRSIGEHHERADGSGYPQALSGEAISTPGGILSLVNHFDNLCYPGNGVQGLTPHEALASLYARERNAFDERALALFVRMMGIYPPGSVVELTDGRIALVVSATPGRPLRPRVVALDSASSLDEALIVDLNREPTLGVHRCLRPEQVPRHAFEWLSLRRRSSYYFEALDIFDPSAAAEPMPEA